MTAPTPLPHAVAIQMCSDFDEASYRCGDPNHSPESCTCLKLARAWRVMERDLAAAQERIAAQTRIIGVLTLDLAAAQEAIAQCRALYNETIQRAVAAEALAERYEALLFKLGAMDGAPCFVCGYSGEGYFDPRIHACAAKHHADKEQK